MRIPFVSQFQDLDRGPRGFLQFHTFNVTSWQCIAGPTLVLFARKLEMPPTWVGVLIGCLAWSIVAIVFSAPLVTRLGAKRLMIVTWLSRNLIASFIFGMPLVLWLDDPRLAWALLLGVTLGFCMVRSIGLGGWLPWLHELIPPRQRASYFAAEMVVSTGVSLVVILIQSYVLRANPSVERYLGIYAFGIAAGLVSVWLLSRVHGGAPHPGRPSARASYGAFKVACTDKAYMYFVLIASLGYSSMSWYGSAIVMYLRDALGWADGNILVLTAIGNASVLVTSRYWASKAERQGSGPVIFLALGAHSLVALLCIAAAPGSPWASPIVFGVCAVAGMGGAGFHVAVHRAMLDYVQEEAKLGYTHTWAVVTAIALGVTPILAGSAIDRAGLDGFRVCFLIAGVTGLALAVASRPLAREHHAVGPVLSVILEPDEPLHVSAVAPFEQE